MDEVVARALGQARLMMILLGIFAGVALLLATLEFTARSLTLSSNAPARSASGWRSAHRQRMCLRLVVGQGMKPVLFGLAIGVVSAFALGRLIASQLYKVSAHNPALLGGATVLLAAIALVACLLPARRASMVDPIQALRTE